MTNNEIWQAVLGEVELSVSPASFTTWFRDTSILGFENDQVVVSVPNGFAKEWLENKYNQYIVKAIKNFRDNTRTVRCIVSASAAKKTPSSKKDIDSALSEKNKQGLVNLRGTETAAKDGWRAHWPQPSLYF